MIIRTIDEYHSDMSAKGANMAFMAFITDDGDYVENGYVVSGYRGADSHKLFDTEEEAQLFVNARTV